MVHFSDHSEFECSSLEAWGFKLGLKQDNSIWANQLLHACRHSARVPVGNSAPLSPDPPSTHGPTCMLNALVVLSIIFGRHPLGLIVRNCSLCELSRLDML